MSAVTGWKSPTANSIKTDRSDPVANPANAYSSDDSYATWTGNGSGKSADVSDVLNYEGFGFTSSDISTGGTIIEISLEVETKNPAFADPGNVINRATAAVKKADGTAGTSDVYPVSATEQYRGGLIDGSHETWGLTLAPSDVFEADFGIEISFITASATNTFSLDHIRLRIEWEIYLDADISASATATADLETEITFSLEPDYTYSYGLFLDDTGWDVSDPAVFINVNALFISAAASTTLVANATLGGNAVGDVTKLKAGTYQISFYAALGSGSSDVLIGMTTGESFPMRAGTQQYKQIIHSTVDFDINLQVQNLDASESSIVAFAVLQITDASASLAVGELETGITMDADISGAGATNTPALDTAITFDASISSIGSLSGDIETSIDMVGGLYGASTLVGDTLETSITLIGETRYVYQYGDFTGGLVGWQAVTGVAPFNNAMSFQILTGAPPLTALGALGGNADDPTHIQAGKYLVSFDINYIFGEKDFDFGMTAGQTWNYIAEGEATTYTEIIDSAVDFPIDFRVTNNGAQSALPVLDNLSIIDISSRVEGDIETEIVFVANVSGISNLDAALDTSILMAASISGIGTLPDVTAIYVDLVYPVLFDAEVAAEQYTTSVGGEQYILSAEGEQYSIVVSGQEYFLEVNQ